MIWWPFAPKPERADTLEVTDLHSDAPPLYSTAGLSFAQEKRNLRVVFTSLAWNSEIPRRASSGLF